VINARNPLNILGIAVVLWLPSAWGLLADRVSFDAAALRFLLALGASYVGLQVLSGVTSGYVRHRRVPASSRRAGSSAPAPPPAEGAGRADHG
jgi:hypothetical protein